MATSSGPGPRSFAIATTTARHSSRRIAPTTAVTMASALAHAVDLDREREVLVRDSPGVVGRQRHPDLVVPDVEIRVVLHGLGLVGDAVDEEDGVREGTELEGLDDLV